MSKRKKVKKLESVIAANLKQALNGYIGDLVNVELNLRKLQDQLLSNMTSLIPTTSNVDVEQDKDDPKKINIKFTFDAKLVDVQEKITIKVDVPLKEALLNHFGIPKEQPVIFRLVCPECHNISVLGDCSSLETQTQCGNCKFQWLIIER